MSEHDPLTAFPRALRAGPGRPAPGYARLPGLVAVHGADAAPAGMETLFTLAGPRIVVCRVGPRGLPRALAGAAVTPVYALGEDGAPAVPTGLVLVRFREGVAAAGCHEALGREGYAVHEVLPYAPAAVWVRATAGGIAAALQGLAALAALPDVVHVEPQMLRPSARR